MIKRVPLVPFPLGTARKASRRFIGLGESVSRFFPSMAFDLKRADAEMEPREWAAISIFSSGFYFVLLFALMVSITKAAMVEPVKAAGVSFLVALTIGGAAFIYINMYPKLMARRKMKSIEKNLPFALHHLLIEVRSGVPLFNCFVSLSRGGYGTISTEFRRVVEEINTGKSEIEMLELLSRENASLYFRRVMWQIVNSIKSGADLGDTLKQIVDSLSVDQAVAIKKYGAQLNPVALVYMIFCVVLPSMGITFLLVLVSFISISISIDVILMLILAFLAFFQFMLMGMIKSRRPVGI